MDKPPHGGRPRKRLSETGRFLRLIYGVTAHSGKLLPFINRFPGRPLIYNIAWKTPIYFAAAFVVRYLEEFIHFYREQGTVLAADRHLLDEVIWTRFWAIQIWLMVLLLIYCTVDELVRVPGKEKLRRIFFGPMPALA